MQEKEGWKIMARHSKISGGATPRFPVLLTDEQLRDLKKLAADMNTDTAALVNRAVVEFIEREKRK